MSPEAQRIYEVLEPELGPHTAAQALSVSCKKAGTTPESMGSRDLDAVTEHIARMCRTLLGRRRSAALVERMMPGRPMPGPTQGGD